MQIANINQHEHHSMEEIKDDISMEITKEGLIANYHRIRHMIFTAQEYVASLQATYGSIFEKKEINDTNITTQSIAKNPKNAKKSFNKTHEEFGVIVELRDMARWNTISHKYTDEEESPMWELIRLLGSLSQCPENASVMCRNWAAKDEVELFKRFYDSCFHLAFDNPMKLNNMIAVYSNILIKRRQVRLCDFFV